MSEKEAISSRHWAKTIRVLRANYRLTQKQFAERIGMTHPRVSKWEQGHKPSLEAAARIAQAFNMSIDDLAFGEQK